MKSVSVDREQPMDDTHPWSVFLTRRCCKPANTKPILFATTKIYPISGYKCWLHHLKENITFFKHEPMVNPGVFWKKEYLCHRKFLWNQTYMVYCILDTIEVIGVIHSGFLLVAHTAPLLVQKSVLANNFGNCYTPPGWASIKSSLGEVRLMSHQSELCVTYW